jgi:hypothetical protein
MSLDTMHKVGELVASIAVVISLIFVGLQVRDNTVATQAASYQASAAYSADILLAVAENPEKARIFNAYVFEDPHNLSADETLQAQYLLSAALRGLENIYIQHQAGMLSEAGWAAREPTVRGLVMAPGYEKFLSSSNAVTHGGPFMEYVEGIRAESNSNATAD